MARWGERHLDVRGAAVPVIPHAWERACVDIMAALGGGGKVVRGRIRYDRDRPSLSRYPHTPGIDGPGRVPFRDVWNNQDMWLAWVVSRDGEVFDPAAAWPELEPPDARNRTLEPFDEVVQAVLAKKAAASLAYVGSLLRKLDCDAPAGRELDPTEVKTFGDILMLPLLDRVGASPVSVAPKDGAGVGGGLLATRGVAKGEVVAAMPVDAVVHHSTLIREFALPMSTILRSGYPVSRELSASLSEAADAVETEPLDDLMHGATMLCDGTAVCVSRRKPKADTFYNLHAARYSERDYNATKVTVTSGARSLAILACAERDIGPGEEIVLRTDTVVQNARCLAYKHAEAVDRAPRQEVYTFTNVAMLIEPNRL